MEIVWLGHSCFRIKGREVTILTDPFDRTLGYPVKKVAPTIVTVSHDHPAHSCVADFTDGCRVVRRPGEYEISNVFITGVPTFHDDECGAVRGKNTAYIMQMENVSICHLGDLGHVPTGEQMEQMSNIDVLMVPVGGGCTLDARGAVETIRLLEPRMAIPMHYKTDVVRKDLEPLDGFLKEMGLKEVALQPKLTVTSSGLPDHTTVALLDYWR
ncbi:MAG: MBL fold metallo-hydrolase [Dehalococcoidia bacterium]|nr:MBL fold metallo-hydrolase [Dehalococcoidia bacterium]